jgi:hypothetical protein
MRTKNKSIRVSYGTHLFLITEKIRGGYESIDEMLIHKFNITKKPLNAINGVWDID